MSKKLSNVDLQAKIAHLTGVVYALSMRFEPAEQWLAIHQELANVSGNIELQQMSSHLTIDAGLSQSDLRTSRPRRAPIVSDENGR